MTDSSRCGVQSLAAAAVASEVSSSRSLQMLCRSLLRLSVIVSSQHDWRLSKIAELAKRWHHERLLRRCFALLLAQLSAFRLDVRRSFNGHNSSFPDVHFAGFKHVKFGPVRDSASLAVQVYAFTFQFALDQGSSVNVLQ